MRIFPCADIRIYGSTLNYGADIRIYGSTLNEIILLLLLLLLPRTPPPCRLFAARCAGERAGNGLGRKVPVQWYKKFRVREQTRRDFSGGHGRKLRRDFGGKVQPVRARIPNMYIYVIDI